MLRRTQQFVLFARGYGFRGAAETPVAAVTYLHYHQGFTIGHHQVQFALWAAVIAHQQLETGMAQQFQSLILGTLARSQMRREIHGDGPGAATIGAVGAASGVSNCGMPLMNVAQSSWR